MSKSDEQLVASLLAEHLGVEFKGCNYRIDTWGEVDDWAELAPDRYLFLEVETNQKHPNTNVLKLWPWLEDHPSQCLVLVQVYFLHSPGLRSSRGRLSVWLGDRLEQLMPSRFKYHRLVVSGEDNSIDGIDALKSTLQQ